LLLLHLLLLLQLSFVRGFVGRVFLVGAVMTLIPTHRLQSTERNKKSG
jgi:hypothetical protein